MSFLESVKKSSTKLAKDISDKHKENKRKRVELAQIRGFLLNSIGVEYLGGYGQLTKSKGFLIFYENQIEYTTSDKRYVILATNLKDLAIEGKEEVNQRVTATRLLALGIFAFAFKKKQVERESYVTLIFHDGQEAIFHVRNIAPLDLKGQLANTLSIIRRKTVNQPSDTTSQSSVADE